MKQLALEVRDEHFIQHALLLAQHAESLGEVPVGAILVQNNEIISEGYNQPIQLNDPTAHAEIVALRAAAKKLNNYRLPNTTLYVTLEPCAMCVGAMMHARIERLVFGAFDPKAGAIKSINHSILWQGGVMENECSTILKNFFARRR